MRSRAAIALAVGAVIMLAGCSASPMPLSFDRSPALSRERTAADGLPAAVKTENVDADTSRYVGTDAHSNRYWVAYALASHDECVIALRARTDTVVAACGGPGLTGMGDVGTVVEFASSPRELSPETAELVGDTLLVKVGGWGRRGVAPRQEAAGHASGTVPSTASVTPASGDRPR